jgi:hypothetical protein
MTRKKALERWETKGSTEVTPQGIWPIAKSLLKRDGTRESTAIHVPSGLIFQPSDAIAECLENQFTHHDLCDENHERRVKTRVQALLEAVDMYINDAPQTPAVYLAFFADDTCL